jgi:5'-nucleotidase
MSNIALFDLDGTLADFDSAMRANMTMLASPGEPDWNPDAEEEEPRHIKFRRRMIKSVPGFWLGLGRMSDGFELLRMAKTVGFNIVILSRGPSQNPLAWKEKIEWCRLNIPYEHSVTLTEDKDLVYGRVLVDDWPPYIRGWLAHRPRGMVIMPGRTWNKGFVHPQVYRYVQETAEATEMTALLAGQLKMPMEE